MSECKNSNCPCDCDNKALHHELARADGKTEVDPSLCCGIDTSHRLRKQLEAERAKVRRLRVELSEVIEQTKCVCGESWTGRGRHSPDCYGYVAESALKALAETAEDA